MAFRMRLYVGVTDFDWYSRLSARPDIDEVNFWSPGGAPFKILQPGELFLFKLKAAHGHAIVGGGVFAHDTLLPLSMAWLAFGYVTISRDRKFEVNPRLREDYENRKDYYDLHGRPLREPKDPAFLPSVEALDWHHVNRWACPGEHLPI